jgi:SAM-dependent methyltransferase
MHEGGRLNPEVWDAYMCIAHKIETHGMNVDHAPVESYQKWVELLHEHAHPDEYPKLLDIGAGCGAEARAFRDAGYEVTAIGLGKENIEHALEVHNVYIHEMDMHHLSFYPFEIYDLAILIQTFEHALAPFVVVGEVFNALKPGGRVLIDIPGPQREDMHTIWHTNLMFPCQVNSLFELWGFKRIYQSTEGFTMIFEKRPVEEIEKWGYLQYIVKLRRTGNDLLKAMNAL